MTANDLVALVALVARLSAPMWKFEPVDIQSVAKDAKAAIEQLQAELLEYQQCLDAGIEHRMRRKAETEAESLRAELEAVKADAERYRWLKTHGEVWGGVPEIGPPGEFMWRWRWTLTRAQYDQNQVDSLTTAIDVARGQGKGDNAGLVGLECDVSHANWGLTEDTAFLDEEENDHGT